MKKLIALAIGAVVGMTFLVSSNVIAADINFEGEYRVRGYVQDYELTDGEDNCENYWDQRFRLTMEAVASDDLKGVVEIDIQDENRKWGTSGHGLHMVQSYIDFNVPETPVNVKIGTQTLALGHSIVLDAELDALLLSTAQDNLSLAAVTAKGSENTTNEYDDNDFYGLIVNMTPQEDMSFGAYFIYEIIGGEDMSSSDPIPAGSSMSDYLDKAGTAYWLGITADVALEPLSLAFELAYYNADVTCNLQDWADHSSFKNYDIEQSGMAVYLNVDYALQDNLNLGLDGIYITGDDGKVETGANANQDSDQFASIAEDFMVATWEEDIAVTSGRIDGVGIDQQYGVQGARIYAKIAATDALSFKGKLGYYMREEKPEKPAGVTVNNGYGDAVGIEFDGFMYYQIMENLKFKAFACYLFTDEESLGEQSTTTGLDIDSEDVWRMGHKISYTF